MPRAAVRRPRESVHEQVLARIAPAVNEAAQEAIIESVFGKEFVSAPLQNPPIPTGLADTTGRLREMMIRRSAISRQGYEQVRNLPFGHWMF